MLKFRLKIMNPEHDNLVDPKLVPRLEDLHLLLFYEEILKMPSIRIFISKAAPDVITLKLLFHRLELLKT